MAHTMIAGGGVYGCGLAYQLGQRGQQATVVERDAIGAGASGGQGRRGVRANGRDLHELPLMVRAQRIWPTLAEEIGGPTGFERTGHLRLFERADYPAHAHIWVERQLGVESEWVGGAVLRALEPECSPDVVGAIFCPNDGVAEHAQLRPSSTASWGHL